MTKKKTKKSKEKITSSSKKGATEFAVIILDAFKKKYKTKNMTEEQIAKATCDALAGAEMFSKCISESLVETFGGSFSD